ncbi:MAG TPA: helix-turn-helix transcriptional regulator [Caulobacteraceae bacterium]|jgi:AraC-like DNA-binding protein|nr:helix-turn-helix transcriptional regulator [Caulobacteraceae bacterium]
MRDHRARGASAAQPRLLRRLLRAKDAMDAASQDPWTVARLAQVSGASPAHFARAFRDAFGLPPHRYLLTRRMERAKQLLRETDLAVTVIAFDTGWSSVGAFGRTFRDVVDQSPGEFRTAERSRPGCDTAMPPCFLVAAHRPDLTIAVSEKRRRPGHDTTRTATMEEA